MTFRIDVGLPTTTVSQRLGMFKPNKTEIPIKFDAGNPANTEIDRQLPIESIDCRLSGSATPGTSFVAPVNGALDLIKEIDLSLNGDSSIIRLPGFYLDWLNVFETGGKRPVYTDVVAGAGPQPFDIGFTLNVDIGSYQSLLDVSRDNELTLDVDWGTADRIAAGGVGTSTIDAATKIEVDTNSIARAGAGQRGGLGFPYWRRFLNYRIEPVNSTTTEQRVRLGRNNEYSSLTFAVFDNGAWSDSILNAVKIKINTTDVRTLTAKRIRTRNMKDYGLDPAELVGLYRIDLAEKNHPEQLLSVSGTQEMDLFLDVTAGTNAKIYIIEDYIQEPLRQ